nr:MAG TPA: hypothetical protein [Caudoviricetes sp.]
MNGRSIFSQSPCKSIKKKIQNTFTSILDFTIHIDSLRMIDFSRGFISFTNSTSCIYSASGVINL